MNYSKWICEGDRGTQFLVKVAHEDGVAIDAGFNLIKCNNAKFSAALNSDEGQELMISNCFEGHLKHEELFTLVFVEYADGRRDLTWPDCVIEDEFHRLIFNEVFVCTVYEETNNDSEYYEDEHEDERLNSLSREYRAFCTGARLNMDEVGDAFDLLANDDIQLHVTQRAWLQSFVIKWEKIENEG